MKRSKIKAVVFDVGGVLALNKKPILIKSKKSVIHSLGVHEYISKKLGLSLDQWFDSSDVYYTMAFEGHISEKETLKIISRNTKTPEKKLKKIIIKAYKKNFKQNKKLYGFAFKLKKMGYKIAILSDQWYLSKEAVILEKYSKKFDAVVVSCDVGTRKPHPEIYKILIKKLNLPAKEILFIDNQEWNLKPAKKLGMKTLLFKNNEKLFEDLERLKILN